MSQRAVQPIYINTGYQACIHKDILLKMCAFVFVSVFVFAFVIVMAWGLGIVCVISFLKIYGLIG